MLELPRHHFELPHLKHVMTPRLSEVPDENDELIRSIDESHEEPWTLDGTPDVQRLEDFWGGVVNDLSQDPEWFSFASDDE